MSIAPQSVITAHNIEFGYGGTPVINGLSLEVMKGEFVGLVGPNGSGKSTLLKLMQGILKPAVGRIELCGIQLSSMTTKDIAQLVTLVPQDTTIDFAFSSREIVAMGRTPYSGRFSPASTADIELINNALQVTKTEELSERLINELSGGERQRVHIARALAQETEIILLDEPTSNLDLSHQLETLQLINSLVQENRSAIAAIHDLSLAARFCNRIVMMVKGEIVADGSPEEVLTEHNLSMYFNIQAHVFYEEAIGGLVILPISFIAKKYKAIIKEPFIYVS
jgi:iron complex transport system ATP-binding protein